MLRPNLDHKFAHNFKNSVIYGHFAINYWRRKKFYGTGSDQTFQLLPDQVSVQTFAPDHDSCAASICCSSFFFSIRSCKKCSRNSYFSWIRFLYQASSRSRILRKFFSSGKEKDSHTISPGSFSCSTKLLSLLGPDSTPGSLKQPKNETYCYLVQFSAYPINVIIRNSARLLG